MPAVVTCLPHVEAQTDSLFVSSCRWATKGIDVGVYIGTQVNANEVTDLMIEEIGQSAYFLQGPLSENIVKGGFVSGHGGNVRPLSPSRSRRAWAC